MSQKEVLICVWCACYIKDSRVDLRDTFLATKSFMCDIFPYNIKKSFPREEY